MTFLKKQKDIIEGTLKFLNHKKYTQDLTFFEGHTLKNFVVYPKVLRPETHAANFLAHFLFFNNAKYKGKYCLDMGCGTGLQGIVMGLYGAKRVILSDISQDAIQNTKDNVLRFKIKKKTSVIQGNLFENIKGKFDVIVFNHPFFSAEPTKNLPGSVAIINNGELLHRFFQEVRKHLKPNGKIIMPFLDVAGSVNNPETQVKKYPYHIQVLATIKIRNFKGFIARGQITIYEIRTKE